jgi:hypothetical protein
MNTKERAINLGLGKSGNVIGAYFSQGEVVQVSLQVTPSNFFARGRDLGILKNTAVVLGKDDGKVLVAYTGYGQEGFVETWNDEGGYLSGGFER